MGIPTPRVALLFVALFATSLAAQANWVWRPGIGPAPRQRAGMVFDSQRGVTVLFGGNNGVATSYNDTWEWDGSVWTQRFPAVSPPVGGLLAYDSARGVSVLVNGSTWEWNGTTWTQRSTQPVVGLHIAYDVARARTVVLTQLASPQAPAITMEWDGALWQTFTTAAGPTVTVMSMTYDPSAGLVAAYTPFQGASNPSAGARLWRWFGGGWGSNAPVVGPYNSGGVMTVGPGALRIYGGDDGSAPILGLYLPFAVSPAVTATNPGGRRGHAMAYDSLRHRFVLFGGYWLHPNLPSQALRGDTWEYVQTSLVAGSTPYGVGCGAPPLALAAAPGSRPVLGATFTGDITNATPFATGMSWGTSGQIYFGAAQLPIDLAFAGMPGCPLWTSADGVLPCTTVGVNTQFQLPVPNTASLFGVALYLQAFTYRPGQNPQQMGVSNGLQVLVGNL